MKVEKMKILTINHTGSKQWWWQMLWKGFAV
jgi:hypothetical protein